MKPSRDTPRPASGQPRHRPHTPPPTPSGSQEAAETRWGLEGPRGAEPAEDSSRFVRVYKVLLFCSVLYDSTVELFDLLFIGWSVDRFRS